MSERGGGFFLRLCASEFSEFFEGANKLCDEAIFVIVPGADESPNDFYQNH